MLQPGKKGFESNELNPALPTKDANQMRKRERPETRKERESPRGSKEMTERSRERGEETNSVMLLLCD
jgi:hypothetical protein